MLSLKGVRLAAFLAALITFWTTSFAQGTKGTAAPAPPARMPPGVLVDPSKEFVTEDFIKVLRSGRTGEYLRGNLELEGAALPWESIPILVTCKGELRYTTNIDSKGNFVIIPGISPGNKSNSDSVKPFAAQFEDCSVEAQLPGFDSSRLVIAKRNIVEDPNIGTVVIWREAGKGDAALSSTGSGAPEGAAKVFERARTDWLANKRDRAQKGLQEAIQIYPQFAEAWYQLGKIQEISGRPEAWASFLKAADADSRFALPYEHLALLAAQAEKWPELASFCKRGLELNPRGSRDMWYYSALGNYHLRKWDVAEADVTRSLSMDPLHLQPNGEQLFGVILAEKGDFADALQHLRKFLTYSPPEPNAKIVRRQIAQIKAAMAHPK